MGWFSAAEVNEDEGLDETNLQLENGEDGVDVADLGLGKFEKKREMIPVAVSARLKSILVLNNLVLPLVYLSSGLYFCWDEMMTYYGDADKETGYNDTDVQLKWYSITALAACLFLFLADVILYCLGHTNIRKILDIFVSVVIAVLGVYWYQLGNSLVGTEAPSGAFKDTHLFIWVQVTICFSAYFALHSIVSYTSFLFPCCCLHKRCCSCSLDGYKSDEEEEEEEEEGEEGQKRQAAYEKEYNDKIMHRYKAGAGAGEEGKFNDTELGYAGPDDMGYVASAGGAPLGMQPKELNEREARRQRRMEREQKRERREEKRRARGDFRPVRSKKRSNEEVVRCGPYCF